MTIQFVYKYIHRKANMIRSISFIIINLILLPCLVNSQAITPLAEMDYTIEDMDERIEELANKLSNSNPEAMTLLKEVFWQGCENWDDLLRDRAALSGKLVLSEFTVNAINSFKKKS